MVINGQFQISCQKVLEFDAHHGIRVFCNKISSSKNNRDVSRLTLRSSSGFHGGAHSSAGKTGWVLIACLVGLLDGLQLPSTGVGGVLDIGSVADGVAVGVKGDVAGDASIGHIGQRVFDGGRIGGTGGFDSL